MAALIPSALFSLQLEVLLTSESLATAEKFDAPLDEVTTNSLDALQAFSRGRVSMMGKGDFTAAIPQLEKAVRLDPKFAMAYAALATCFYDLGESAKAADYAKQAYNLRDRVSERERLAVESQYHLFATGNLEKARQALELWAETYPRDLVAQVDRDANYGTLGPRHRPGESGNRNTLPSLMSARIPSLGQRRLAMRGV